MKAEKLYITESLYAYIFIVFIYLYDFNERSLIELNSHT